MKFISDKRSLRSLFLPFSVSFELTNKRQQTWMLRPSNFSCFDLGKLALNKSKMFLVWMAGLAFFGWAAAVSADVINVKYRGVISFGYDTTGVFGRADAILTGRPYVAHFTFDTDLGDRFTFPPTDRVAGGAAVGTISPVLSSWIKIKNQTVSHNGQYLGQLTHTSTALESSVLHFSLTNETVGDITSFILISGNANAPDATFPPFVTDPYTVELGASFVSSQGPGVFDILVVDQTTGMAITAAFAELQPTFVSFSPIAVVPEPETYALLLAGLGLLGFAARRRKLRNSNK